MTRPIRLRLLVAEVAAILLIRGTVVAQQDIGNYFANHPGRSIGIPACRGNAPDVNCYRIDEPAPPDTCLERDPVTHSCLATAPNFAYPSTLLSPSPATGRVLLGGARSCDASDPECVPGGIHTQQDIDWSQVEGAEFMIAPRKELEGSMNIFVDSNTGNDQSGWGTRESPLRSLRAGLKRWLMPGKCFPFCGSSALSRSGTLHVRPGVYSGTDNREIQLLINTGVSVTIKVDADTQGGERGVSTSRDPGVEVRIEGGAYWLKVAGAGTLSLLSMSVRNSSSDAILVDASTQLITDLHFAHGRYGQVLRSLDANGEVVTSANWDISVDERFVGKDINCDSSAGCVVTRRTHGFDSRYYGPLPDASSQCTSCSVPAPSPADGVARNSPWHFGLGALVTFAGTGCANGGILTAVSSAGVGGSGFSATFSVSDGAISGIIVTDPGSGYTGVEGVKIRIEVGGDGCTETEFLPYLVYDSGFL